MGGQSPFSLATDSDKVLVTGVVVLGFKAANVNVSFSGQLMCGQIVIGLGNTHEEHLVLNVRTKSRRRGPKIISDEFYHDLVKIFTMFF